MKIYLVGGAVRDELLKRPIKEKDWVVVGASSEEMLQQGFKQVGKDFPVFLHPKTKEEYALARVERKVGKGYTGFTFDTSKAVTLEEDLMRRDLTINAIAKDEQGNIIDPCHGVADLKNKILRHVSNAFIEDPVRILRVARFAARFADFTIADETNDLMKKMVSNGEVNALVAERVWKEWERALQEDHPEKFFIALENCGAKNILFKESFSLEKLVIAAQQSKDPKIRFAVLCATLSPDEIKNLCDRYRIPSDYRDLSMLVAKYFPEFQKTKQFLGFEKEKNGFAFQAAKPLSAEEILTMLQTVDAFRRTERFKNFLTASEIASQHHNVYQYFYHAYEIAQSIDIKKILEAKLNGKEIEEQIRLARLQQLQKNLK